MSLLDLQSLSKHIQLPNFYSFQTVPNYISFLKLSPSYLLPRSAADFNTRNSKQRIVVFRSIFAKLTSQQNTIPRVHELQNPPEKSLLPVFILVPPLIIHDILNVAPNNKTDLKQLCSRYSSPSLHSCSPPETVVSQIFLLKPLSPYLHLHIFLMTTITPTRNSCGLPKSSSRRRPLATEMSSGPALPDSAPSLSTSNKST